VEDIRAFCFTRTTVESVAVASDCPQHAAYNPPPCTPFPLPLTRQNTMISDAPDDTDILIIQPGQISPGCLTAGAVLDGHSGWQEPWSPAPTFPQHTNFAPTIPPTRTQNPWTTLNPGSLIFFQLDEQELAARLRIPENSGLLGRCPAPTVKKYVGLIMGTFNGSEDSAAQEYTIAFVSKTLPPGSSQNPERSMFAVPIVAPKGAEENPIGRPQLRARLFPWTGCYQYTVLGTRIIPTHINHSAIEYKLDEEDFLDFDDLVMEDYAELVRRLPSITSSMSVEEALVFENMIVDTAAPLPVEVWQELKADQEVHDPREFVEEALRFGELAEAAAEELGSQ